MVFFFLLSSIDGPKQMAVETAKTPKEELPCEPTSPTAAHLGPEVQKQSSQLTVAAQQEASVAQEVGRGAPPPDSAECQGQFHTLTDTLQFEEPLGWWLHSHLVWLLPDPADVESVVLEEAPKQAPRPLNDVQQAWNQETQQKMWLFIIISDFWSTFYSALNNIIFYRTVGLLVQCEQLLSRF